MKKLIPQKLKNIYHLCRSFFSAIFFGFPAKKIKVIGVTGTNGKTTTVQMISKILEEAGKNVAVASTINFKIGKDEWVNKTKFTTLSGWHVQKFFSKAVNSGCEYLVLEVASHALDQNRVWGIEFDVVVITNVTREHLDYHKTMDQYRAAKLKLFEMVKESGTAVVNLGMEGFEEFLGVFEGKRIGYLLQNQKSRIKNQNDNAKIKIVQADEMQSNNKGSIFELEGVQFKLNLVGGFNVENALAAVCVGFSQGISLEICSRALKKIKVIPGRMDEVKNDRGLKIFIDYALTPDSMEKLGQLATHYLFSEASAQRDKLETIYPPKLQRRGTNSKLIWVFGSCGERDRGKRPIMGEIVAKYADYAIVTNEDPYNEDPQQIIEEVFAGVSRGGKIEGKNGFKIFDRKQAIKKALELAQKGDIILITGKGAEETMAFGDRRIHWNDREVTEGLLSEE